jgi:hypothetical protein
LISNPPQYLVVWSRNAISGIKEFAERSRPVGGGQELGRLLRLIDHRLRDDPLAVGEVYRSRGHVVEHCAVQDFVGIDFAIDTERRLVLVRQCSFLSKPGS